MKKQDLYHLQAAVKAAPPLTCHDITNCSVFLHRTVTNKDGTPLKARRNGYTRTWKTRPTEFRIPVKYGLKTCFYITHENADQWAAKSSHENSEINGGSHENP